MHVHSILIFHVEQRCLLFHGQVDDTKASVLTSDTLTTIFEAGQGLLIGQGTVVPAGNEQFAVVNHEDIMPCVHVSVENDVQQAAAIDRVVQIGKAFKNAFQSDIDELDVDACDVNATFGAFAGHLQALLDANEPGTGEPAPGAAPSPVTTTGSPARHHVVRFPGGVVAPEERDEVLFQQYQDLIEMYNVDMIDGVISKARIYLYSDLNQHHEIELDFSTFPGCPTINGSAAIDDVLPVSRRYQCWNHEEPPRIVDLVAELESLLQEMRPRGTATTAAVPEPPATVSASRVLADRLATRERDTPSLFEEHAPEPLVIRDAPAIDVDDTPVARRTPASGDGRHGEPVAAPVKFVIKPRFQASLAGDNGNHEPAPAAVAVPAPAPAPAREPPARQEPASAAVHRSTPGASKPTVFAIPSIDDIDQFTPATAPVQRPAIAPAPVSKPPAARAAPAPVPRTPAPAPSPAPSRAKKKDDGVMFDWSDDEEEMEIKPRREIKDDFDMEIKKVD